MNDIGVEERLHHYNMQLLLPLPRLPQRLSFKG